jgi:proteasome accessory factor B
MASSVERITNLLALLLSTRQPITAQQIFDELAGQYPDAASPRRSAFERDKALLREVGVPIRSTVLDGQLAGQTGYWVERREYELADLDLADDERHALQTAVAMIRSTDAQFGLFKLGGAAMASPVVAPMPLFDALPTIHAAVESRTTIGFTYRDEQRVVDPYALLLRSGRWYVVGRDHDRDALRTFRVDRMGRTTTLDDVHPFVRPEGFDVRNAFPTDARQLGDDGGQVATVVVAASRAAAVVDGGDARVVDRGADGSVTVEVPCGNADAFRAWLFDLDVDAVVIGPPEVRAAVIDWLVACAGGGGEA